MDTKKMIRKSGGGTLFGLLVTIVMSIAIFFGMFSYLSYHAAEQNLSLGANYTKTQDSMNNSLVMLNQNMNDMKGAMNGITENQNGFGGFIYNGLVGFWSLLRLPIVFITITYQTYLAFLDLVSTTFGIPSWALMVVSVAIIGYVILLLVSIWKGDQQKIH